MTHRREQTLPYSAVIPIARGAGERVGAAIRLCGMPVIERLLRTLRAAGLRDVVIIAGDAEQGWLPSVQRRAGRLGLSVRIASP